MASYAFLKKNYNKEENNNKKDSKYVQIKAPRPMGCPKKEVESLCNNKNFSKASKWEGVLDERQDIERAVSNLLRKWEVK